MNSWINLKSQVKNICTCLHLFFFLPSFLFFFFYKNIKVASAELESIKKH